MTDRPSAAGSALFHPDDCCLVFVDFYGPPSSGDSAATLDRTYRDILRLATKLSVPLLATFRSAGDTVPINGALAAAVSSEDQLIRVMINPWKDAELRERVFEFDRNRLILIGGCSEGSLMQAALSALEDIYDVGIIFDLSDEKLGAGITPMAQRLIQAGVVPLTARQLLLEWAATTGGDDESFQ